ncbi:MAG TPA: LysE family transporter [Thermoplasmata archaeon]|nr:LysE family transporter [Thermoplasmata archaeon]
MVLEALAGAGISVLLALSLAAPPGPVNALIASHAVTRSWRAGFLVGLGAMTVDLLWLTLSALAHSFLLQARSAFPVIALLGAGVMAYLAWGAAKAWKAEPVVTVTPRTVHATSYVTGVASNLTSPYPILWWLTAGIALIDELGPLVLVGFFAGLLLWTSAFPYLLRAVQQRYARTYHIVLAFSIAVLVVFAVYLAWTAFAGFP